MGLGGLTVPTFAPYDKATMAVIDRMVDHLMDARSARYLRHDGPAAFAFYVHPDFAPGLVTLFSVPVERHHRVPNGEWCLFARVPVCEW